MFELAHVTTTRKVLNVSRNSRHRVIGHLITEMHLVRRFLLPAMWLVLRKLGDTRADSPDFPHGVPEINTIRYIVEAATRHRSANTGTDGHTIMSALRAEASPYWYAMNDAIEGTKPLQPESERRRESLSQIWQQLGEALQLNRKRAPRQIEGPPPAVQLFCSWPFCVYHSQKPPNALKSCKGCSEVRYCGKQCQVR